LTGAAKTGAFARPRTKKAAIDTLQWKGRATMAASAGFVEVLGFIMLF